MSMERLGFGGILSIAVMEQPLCVFSSSIPDLYLLSLPNGDNCHCPWGFSDIWVVSAFCSGVSNLNCRAPDKDIKKGGSHYWDTSDKLHPMALEMGAEIGTRPFTVWKRSRWFLSFPVVASVLVSVLHLMDRHQHVIRSCSSTCALLQVLRIQTEMQE